MSLVAGMTWPFLIFSPIYRACLGPRDAVSLLRPSHRGTKNVEASSFLRCWCRMRWKESLAPWGVWHDSSLLLTAIVENTVPNTPFIESLRHEWQASLLIFYNIKFEKRHHCIVREKRGSCLIREKKGNCYCVLLPFIKECNYDIRASQLISSLTKFIVNSISSYVSK